MTGSRNSALFVIKVAFKFIGKFTDDCAHHKRLMTALDKKWVGSIIEVIVRSHATVSQLVSLAINLGEHYMRSICVLVLRNKILEKKNCEIILIITTSSIRVQKQKKRLHPQPIICAFISHQLRGSRFLRNLFISTIFHWCFSEKCASEEERRQRICFNIT